MYKCTFPGGSFIFHRVYNFSYEKDGAGVFIQNCQEKRPVESNSRWMRKITRSPGNLLNRGPSCFGAVFMNIQYGFVDHLQKHEAKQPPDDNLARKEQPATLLVLTKGSPAWSKTQQHQPLGRSSPDTPLPTAAQSTIRPLLLASFTACAGSNPQTADSQRVVKMTVGKKLW